ncbi:MAG: hypothetical protein WCX33_02005, partial [Candidatus Shapirobacteria bacterium]
MSQRKKNVRIFWIIIGITFLCLVLNLPRQLPIKIHLGKVNWEHTFYRPELNLNLGSFKFSKNIDLKYGLDLAGGSALVFDIDTSNTKKEDIPQALESLKGNIERRVNLFGVSETNVQVTQQQNKHRLKVELPGIEDISDAVKLIGTTAQLAFKGEIDIPPEATATAKFNDV